MPGHHVHVRGPGRPFGAFAMCWACIMQPSLQLRASSPYFMWYSHTLALEVPDAVDEELKRLLLRPFLD